jgi:teichuronic acid biosynthesis glycosyltransferase TuaG
MDFVSIITPSYNSERYIHYCIKSIQNQTYINWELIIIDDHSTDSTVEIVKKFQEKDSRILLQILEVNYGAGIARNHGIKIAKGRYIAFCDSDDQWKAEKLEKQLAFMKNNDLSFSFCSYDVIKEEGDFCQKIKAPEVLTYSKLLNNNYVGCLTAIYDTNSLGKLYMPDIRKRQDWALWLKILQKINVTKGQKDSLAIYRDRPNSISKNKINLLRYTWLIYFKELEFSYLKSTFQLIKFLYFYARKKINS